MVPEELDRTNLYGIRENKSGHFGSVPWHGKRYTWYGATELKKYRIRADRTTQQLRSDPHKLLRVGTVTIRPCPVARLRACTVFCVYIVEIGAKLAPATKNVCTQKEKYISCYTSVLPYATPAVYHCIIAWSGTAYPYLTHITESTGRYDWV